MSWKLLRWPLLIGATTAAVAFSSNPATPQHASCPGLGTLAAIILSMLVATTSIHGLITFIQAELFHSGRITAWYSNSGPHRFMLVTLGALITAGALFLDIILWAWMYRHTGAIHGLEASLYFSGITFTTVGYGDITLARCWHLLSVGEAVNGVLMAGWSAAQLIFIVQHMMSMAVRSQDTGME